MINLLTPTIAEIDQLTAYLAILYADGFKPVKKWRGGDKNKDGFVQIPYPEYDRAVVDFFHAAVKNCWLDDEYLEHDPQKLIENEETIKAASIAEIKTMLTYCVRGERFCDGHWAAVIEKGYVRQILERLIQMRQ